MKASPAISPYSPKDSIHVSSVAASATSVIAVFLLVYRYWESRRLDSIDEQVGRNNKLWEYILQRPGNLLDRVRNAGLLPSITNTTYAERKSRNSKQYRMNGCDSNGTFDNSAQTRKDIRNNHREIHNVLTYWFGQHAPEKSQKMLWMIAASSAEHRQKVDAEIADRFEVLLLELSSINSGRWEDWCLDEDGIYGARGKIAAIIVLDQFSRHILRHYRNQTNQKLPTKDALDKLALKTAELLVTEHSSELDCGMIPLPMRVFALMPYRHASTMESVKYVQQTVEEMATLEEQNEAMIGRFRKATNRRLAVLQDEARRTGKSEGSGDNNANDDQPKQQFSDDDILETFPFEADMTPALQHPIHKTIVQFLSDHGIQPSNAKPNQNDGTTSRDAVIVSLSGGVDSMVIASVLAHLKNSCGYDHLTILAVHIDYANRPESGAEADYVRRYCEEQLDGAIEFHCRRIGEVTRGITARDDYERIAREIRYDSYRDAVSRAKDCMGLNTKDERKQKIVGVMLGHHRGDLRENVLSNAHKGCGPLDLSGMTSVSKNDGITIYRPLLPLEKSFVFDYAHKFGVPYYKDTTPHWSTRGKLRNKLLPLLEEIYGDGSMNNLSNLAVESDACRNLMNKSMIEPFLTSIVRKRMGIILDTASWKDQPLFFWKVVLREALHSVGLGMFSDKSVIEFLKRIQTKKLKAAWLQCRKDYGVYLQADGRVFVFYPSSFPWNKKDLYQLDGEAVELGVVKKVGPWDVSTEVISEGSLKSASPLPGTWLAKKAILSMESFMDGKVEYFINAPTWQRDGSFDFSPRPLVFRQFSKADRPQAWKNCDLRIQSTLPVLGNDLVASNTLKDMVGNGLTHEVNGETKQNPERLIRVSITLRDEKGDE